jgi:Tryptophan-associated transmembrane protein (Trp_oprn_chp)
MERLTRKRTVLVLVLAAASVVLVSGSREWVSGSVDDVVLGAGALHGSGSDLAPGALAAALVGMASAVAAATSGRVVRVVAACSAVMAAVLGATVVISVVVDPGGALGRMSAAGTGRSGTLAAHGHVGSWAWVALAAMLVMGIGGLGALAGGRRWQGLSSRYEAGEPAAGHPSAWDQLSRGEDPTAEHPIIEH